MSQEQDILAHLKRHGKINPMEALNLYGCMRLAARIDELKVHHNIYTNMVYLPNRKHFAEYILLKQKRVKK